MFPPHHILIGGFYVIDLMHSIGLKFQSL